MQRIELALPENPANLDSLDEKQEKRESTGVRVARSSID